MRRGRKVSSARREEDEEREIPTVKVISRASDRVAEEDGISFGVLSPSPVLSLTGEGLKGREKSERRRRRVGRALPSSWAHMVGCFLDANHFPIGSFHLEPKLEQTLPRPSSRASERRDAGRRVVVGRRSAERNEAGRIFELV